MSTPTEGSQFTDLATTKVFTVTGVASYAHQPVRLPPMVIFHYNGDTKLLFMPAELLVQETFQQGNQFVLRYQPVATATSQQPKSSVVDANGSGDVPVVQNVGP